VAKSFYANGNVSWHYDRALNPLGKHSLTSGLPVMSRASARTRRLSARPQKSFDNVASTPHIHHFFFVAMLGSRLFPGPISSCSPTILQFPAEPTRAVHTLRIMTTQLLQEASQIIPNPQLLINVISKRVRQLGLGHRPMVETGPRASLTDIALKEIIAGKLTFEEQSASTDGA
jgi:DNA-directed RNA polymerase subunit omega